MTSDETVRFLDDGRNVLDVVGADVHVQDGLGAYYHTGDDRSSSL